MSSFYSVPGFSFQDFDIFTEDNVLYACYIKKVPYLSSQHDAHQPNCYAMAKSLDGKIWQDIGDIIVPVPETWEETIWAGSIAKAKQGNRYVIYYTGTTTQGRNNFCKIGKAYSGDLIHWEKDQKNPVFVFDPENPYYSNELKLAFRDPFPFEYNGKRYILFAAKDKAKSDEHRGCVGVVEEMENGTFQWMPPLFSPGIYADGLECPALYEIKGRWYLLYGIDKQSEEKAFRYAVSDSPFGPFTAFKDNQLLSSNNYNCRIVEFRGKYLLYNWFRSESDGVIREYLAPPKEVHILFDKRISLSELE